MTSRSRPWKQFMRKLSDHILAEVAAFDRDTCLAGCVRRISKQEIRDGAFAHIGLQQVDGVPSYPDALVPDPSNGRYSKANVAGKTIRLIDEPMVQKTYSQEVPNYGDWGKGSHEIEWTRDVYQQRYMPPRELAIRIEYMAEEFATGQLVFRFIVDEVLDRRAKDFHERLLFNLNLLQENVGNHGVFPSDATVEDYLATLYVNWEILPPGEREETIARIVPTGQASTPQLRRRIEDRYEVLKRLNPQHFIRGVNGFRRYFGAQFAPDLVAFENLDYGNAIYVMFEDWAELSQKSRTELLAQHPDDIIRIPHTGQWKARLATTVQNALRERQEP